MCAISCRITSARRARSARVAAPRWMKPSVKVTRPGFSIAPRLYSGTKIESYFPHGYGKPNAWS